MTTTNKNSKIYPGYEPIAGYKLQQLIGRGGFGEVWRSEAPGGLHKAVKFVYGATDEHQAVRELRSLERIKGVQHPFLLTLERFGVVDERLVIVTELADGSLEEVYNRHRERGSCGIPRASLLSYLHDAADALDYLHNNYQLQHLDIKPGNLLLVGGHVKVGDFGLLKDLRDADCSIVGGLTPVYAPPELFDGRPSMHSDQYSLAVMYQELLTGTRPFGGRTIAQLATQHVHSAPNLSPLPAADRPVIARALEKDPNRRFNNCCEFFDALRASQSSGFKTSFNSAQSEKTGTRTGVMQTDDGGPAHTVKDLPQLKITSPQTGVRITGHSLVVAVGGAGAQVLHLLRDRVASHRAACPLDLHSILIDTDVSTIQAARLAEVSDRVPVCQTIHTPLRSPQEYKSYQGVKYKSISRRWLYNLPRNGTTEGMRPLGRLALVDHGDHVMERIQESIRHLSAVAGRATPRVYVVSSVDGGTGSGMVLDLLYLIRHTLDKESMADVQVLPLLLTGRMVRNNNRPLASSDAAATFAEMNYFLNPGNGYPGDPAVDWPSVPAARTPLADAYIIAAGLNGDLVPDPVDTACEYIWADSTGCGDFLAAARTAAEEETIAGERFAAKVRSVGMVRLRTPKLLEENLLAPSIVRKLLYRWLGDPTEARQLAPDLAQKLSRRCGLTKDQLTKSCAGQWPVDQDLRRLKLEQVIAALPESVRTSPQAFEKALHELNAGTMGDCTPECLAPGIATLKREISVRLSDGRFDIALVLELLDCMKLSITAAVAECREPTNPESHKEPEVGDAAEPSQPPSIACLVDRWLWRLIRFNVAEVLEHLRYLITQLKERVSDRASLLAQSIEIVSQRLTGNDDEVLLSVDEGIRNRVGSVTESLRKQVSSAVVAAPLMSSAGEAYSAESLLLSLLDHALPLIDTAISWSMDEPQAVANPAPPYPSIVNPAVPVAETVVANINASKPVVDTNPAGNAADPKATHTSLMRSNAMVTTSTSIMASPANESNDSCRTNTAAWDDAAIIENAIRAMRPALLACGGYQRILLTVGTESERERLEPKVKEAYQGPLTTAVIPGTAAMLICEAQQIRLTDIHSRIVTLAGNDQDLMGRLAARNDIDWKSALTGDSL